MKNFLILPILALALTAFQRNTMAQTGYTVNLHSRINTTANPVVLTLEAGNYRVEVVGPSEGGLYTAWNPWGIVRGCQPDGTRCTEGWQTSATILSDAFGSVGAPAPGLFQTPEQALVAVHGLSTSFSLPSRAAVRFFIKDSHYTDNVGGVSLRINQVSGTQPDECQRDLEEARKKIEELQDKIDRLNDRIRDLENTIQVLTIENGLLKQRVKELEGELQQLKTALKTGLANVQNALRNAFSDPNFVIPGATPEEQYQNLIAAIVNLTKGRLEGLYVNLGGKPGKGSQ